jgi:phosphate transport system substrate-binding protein
MNILKKLKILCLTAVALIGLEANASNYNKNKITISGSDTFEDNVLYTQYEIENRTGIIIDIKGNSSMGNSSMGGIMDLVDGKADLAMTSASLEVLAKKLKNVDFSKLKEFEIKEIKMGFLVNPKNKIDYLTLDQIRKIYTGEITNWKEFGGDDAKILILSRGKNSGTESMIDEYLGIKSRSQDIREEYLTRKIINMTRYSKEVISSFPVDLISPDEENGKIIKILKTDKPLKQKLYLVTNGEPNDAAKKIIDVARELSKD